MEKYIVWAKIKEGNYGILYWLELNEPYIFDFNIDTFVKLKQETADRNKANLLISYVKIMLKKDSINTIYDPNGNVCCAIYCDDRKILSPVEYVQKEKGLLANLFQFGDIIR